MLAVLGAAMICAVCAGYGFYCAHKLAVRERTIRDFIFAAELCRLEIGHRLTPLPELLVVLKREGTRLKDFFELVSSLWESKGWLGFAAAWREALTGLELKEDDRAALYEMGALLGRYDGDSQAKSLSMIIAALERRLAAAAEDRAKKSKLYCVLGTAAGLTAFIFVL